MKPIIRLVIMSTLLLSGCGGRDKKGNILDSPTSGHIKIAVDESLKPLLEAEVNAFQAIYMSATISASYTSEADAIDALLNDSVRLAVVTRKLTSDEVGILSVEKIVPVQINLATDAVALILNRNNPDSLLKVSQLNGITHGTITHWDQVSKASKHSPIELVFDHPASGIVRFLNDSVGGISKLPPNCFAVKSNSAVIDYVSKQPNAIGLIGVGWISDKDDSKAKGFLKSIRVARVSRDSAYLQPYQAYIALHQYPLCRNVIVISREARAGLGSGFIAFVASERGQRVVLKSGLIPATMPLRIVDVNRKKIE